MSRANRNTRLAALVWAALVLVAVLPHSSALAASPFAQANRVAQARVVKIYGAGIGRQEGYGTGIVVSGQGHILTAHGVYLAGRSIRVVLPDGSVQQAKVIRRSLPLQTVLLKIPAKTPDYFELSEKANIAPGEWVLAVSNLFKIADGREQLSITLGTVSLRAPLETKRGVQDFPYEGDALVLDCITSNPGAGGGAVVDVEGNLVGMIGKVIESKNTNTRLNYAVPVDLLARFVAGEKLATGDKPPMAGPGELGIRLFTLGGVRGPAYIDRVKNDSPADKAGLRPDDLILSVDGETVRSVRDYTELAKKIEAGRKVVLTVKRKKELLQITLTSAAKE